MVIVIKEVSIGGLTISSMIITKGAVILRRQFSDVTDNDLLVGTSDSSYLNDSLFFAQFQHQEEFSQKTQSGEHRLLLIDSYDSHLTYTALKFVEMRKVIIFLLPSYTSYFLQPLNVSVFQKHPYAQVLNRLIRYGLGPFNKSSFFAYLEEIRKETLIERIIKAGFRKCSYQPFRLREVLQQLVVDGVILEQVQAEASSSTQRQAAAGTPSPPSPPSKTYTNTWSSLIAYRQVIKRANDIEYFMRSLAEPPELEELSQFRVNLSKFLSTIKAKEALMGSLTDYIQESSIAQG